LESKRKNGTFSTYADVGVLERLLLEGLFSVVDSSTIDLMIVFAASAVGFEGVALRNLFALACSRSLVAAANRFLISARDVFFSIEFGE
jgi:hypothetical protein